MLELLRSLTQSAACCALGIICIARNNCSLFVATRHVRNSAFRNFVCIRSFSEVLGRDVPRLAYVKNTSAPASACFIIFDTLVPADADRSILPYEARSTRRLTTDQNCSQGPTTLVIKFGEHLASPVDESPLRLLPNFMTSLRCRKNELCEFDEHKLSMLCSHRRAPSVRLSSHEI